MIATLLAGIALQAAGTPDPRPAVEAHEERPAPEDFIAKGLALYRKRHFQAARKAFQEAVEADPANAAAHFYLGYTLYKIGEPKRRLTPEKVRAREEFARAFELDHTFRPSWPW